MASDVNVQRATEERDRARGLAVALEGELARVVDAVREHRTVSEGRFAGGLPHDHHLYRTVGLRWDEASPR
jgi:hypothetical protein